MNKIFTCALLVLVLITIIPTSMAYGENINTETHKITISKEGDALSIKESITIQGTSNETYDTISFWVSSEAQNTNALVSNNEVSYAPIGNNEYICNISSFNITADSSIQLTILSFTRLSGSFFNSPFLIFIY